MSIVYFRRTNWDAFEDVERNRGAGAGMCVSLSPQNLCQSIFCEEDTSLRALSPQWLGLRRFMLS